MTSSMENRPSDSVVWACRLPFSADIGELPAAGREDADGASGRVTAGGAQSVAPSGPEEGGASLVLVLSRGHPRRQGEEDRTGIAYPVLVKSFLSRPNLGLAFGLFISRMGNSMGQMSGEATKYGGPVAPQFDVKRASTCVNSRSAVGFVMISTAPSSRARAVSLVSA